LIDSVVEDSGALAGSAAADFAVAAGSGADDNN
jgi:hypothetical protein